MIRHTHFRFGALRIFGNIVLDCISDTHNLTTKKNMSSWG